MADESNAPVAAVAATDAPPAEPTTVPASSGPAPATLASLAASTAASTPGLGTGATTPMLSPEEIEKSLKVSLADLTAKATALYLHKNYEEAAELFSKAAEMQAEMNGDMSPANAEILFLYGRCLLKVGQAKSDVFGGKAPEGTSKRPKPAPPNKAVTPAEKPSTSQTDPAPDAASSVAEASAKPDEPTPAERITEEGVAILAAEAGGAKKEQSSAEVKKPLFQFEGDGDIDDSDEEEDEEAAEGEGEDGEELDDLGNAYEILDMARILFDKQLAALTDEATEGKGKAKEEPDSPSLRHVKERLADTHDLLAEISLEGERFHDAIPDSRKSLEFKKQLFPPESDILAEAHFKLSLALEFASIVATDEEKTKGVQHVDQALRDEAATELEAAIASTKMKLQNKEVELATNHSPEDNDVTRKQIADIKEVIADMEQRLVDLRGTPMDVDALLGKDNPLGGILGAALGETPAQVEARIQEAKKTATDLTGLVRKKAVAPNNKDDPPKEAETNGSNNKRKLEEPEVEDAKKARTE